MDEVERRVLDAIDMDRLVSFLRELIAIPSLGGHERDAQDEVAAAMREIDLDVDDWNLDLAQLRSHPMFAMEVERTEGRGVVGTLRGEGGGKSLILNGHVDVVPPGDPANWRFPPWEGAVHDGRVHGRGSVDMKGGLACALFAVKAIHDAGARLRGSVILESVIGEEDGGVGTLAACLRGYHADGAVVVEPTQLRVAPSQAGALTFRITVPGLSAHACVREEGVSAFEKFLPIHAALLDLERERNREVQDPLYRRYRLPFALSLGRIEAGNWSSSVPESLVAEGRLGVRVGEDPEAARKALEVAVRRAASADAWLRDHPVKVEWWGGQFHPASVPIDHPLPQTVAGALADASGSAAAFEGMTYGSDMRLLIHVGKTPAVLFGPGDVRHAHRPNESVSLSDLRTMARTLALTVLRFCGAFA
ncbi:MAG TPA: ArgE/DapE family deacylase [Thermoplasmata archaeon]|nr:ArgE/DapE family deacylase [Thermoplasmata archaeon]